MSSSRPLNSKHRPSCMAEQVIFDTRTISSGAIHVDIIPVVYTAAFNYIPQCIAVQNSWRCPGLSASLTFVRVCFQGGFFKRRRHGDTEHLYPDNGNGKNGSANPTHKAHFESVPSDQFWSVRSTTWMLSICRYVDIICTWSCEHWRYYYEQWMKSWPFSVPVSCEHELTSVCYWPVSESRYGISACLFTRKYVLYTLVCSWMGIAKPNCKWVWLWHTLLK